YEMLTHEPPFKGKSVIETMTLRLRTDPEPPHKIRKDCPEELSRIVLKAMARDYKARYQTAREMYEDLQDLVRERSGKPRASGTQPAVQKSSGSQQTVPRGSGSQATVPRGSGTQPTVPGNGKKPVIRGPVPPEPEMPLAAVGSAFGVSGSLMEGHAEE